MNLLFRLELQSIVQKMRNNLKSTRIGIHIQQRVGRDAIPIRIDSDIASDARKAAIPHATHNIRTIDGSAQHAGVLANALVQRIRIEQDAVEEGCDERRDGFVLAERVIVLGRGDVFDLRATKIYTRISHSRRTLPSLLVPPPQPHPNCFGSREIQLPRS